jgi:23S rRNA pseudouridine2605 synthase
MRLAKHLAQAGVASRRVAETMVQEGRVTVEGDVVRDPARDVSGDEAIALDGKPLPVAPARRMVYAVHKPAGVVSTARDTHGRPTVLELVPSSARLYPVGRLDADTTGLILLTDDGELANRLMHPSFEVPKTYRVKVAKPPVREAALHALRNGVELEDGMTAPALVRRLHGDELDITIHEGRKRQVRRMCDAVGHPVKEIERIAFGPLRLGALPRGQARKLTPAETQRLRGLT